MGPVTQDAPGESAAACLPVDAVVVRPGHGALVKAMGAGGTKVGDTMYVVADNGVKYRVPSGAALQALGYTNGDVVALPSPLLSMLPSGPDLNPEIAAGGGAPPSRHLRAVRTPKCPGRLRDLMPGEFAGQVR